MRRTILVMGVIGLAVLGFYFFVGSELTKPHVLFDKDESIKTWGDEHYRFVDRERKVLYQSEKPNSTIVVYDANSGDRETVRAFQHPEGLFRDRFLLVSYTGISRHSSRTSVERDGRYVRLHNMQDRLCCSILDLARGTSISVSGEDPELLFALLSRLLDATDNGEAGLQQSVERYYFNDYNHFFQVTRPRERDTELTVSLHTMDREEPWATFLYQQQVRQIPGEIRHSEELAELRLDQRPVLKVDLTDGTIQFPLTGETIASGLRYRETGSPRVSGQVSARDFVPIEQAVLQKMGPLAQEYVSGYNIKDVSADGQWVIGDAISDEGVDGIFSRSHVRLKTGIGMVRHYLLIGLGILFLLVVVLTHSYRVVFTRTTTTYDEDGNVVSRDVSSHETHE